MSEKSKIPGIYSIKNKENNKIYIGISNDYDRRVYEHKKLLKGNRHKNIHLQRAYNKNKDCFEFQLLEQCEDEKLRYLKEIEYIQKYKANKKKYGYNMTEGGDIVFIKKYTEEDKIQESIKRGGKPAVALFESGKIIEFINLAGFCRDNNFIGANILKILKSKKQETRKIANDTTFFYKEKFEELFSEFQILIKNKEENKIIKNYTNNKPNIIIHIVIDPNGNIYETNNTVKFCEEFDLDKANLHSTKIYKRRYHKGWKCFDKETYDNLNINQKFYIFYIMNIITNRGNQ